MFGREHGNEGDAASGGEDHTQSKDPPRSASLTVTEGRQYLPPAVPSSRVVAKPTPTQNPRLFQIGQIKRRYNALETSSSSGSGSVTLLAFSLIPSDPDFPFDLPKGLKCVLHVPSSYLQPDGAEGGTNGGEKPRLDVKNAEMSRGYQINVERGFAKLVERSPELGLLGWMKELDKRLEKLLAEGKAEVVTFVPNTKAGMKLETGKQPTAQPNPAPMRKDDAVKPPPPQPSYTPAQLREASLRRETETRQLEARIGRLPLFSKSADGIAYTIPITPRKPTELPVPLQGVKAVKLYVPTLYPLQHCRIELQGMSRDAARKTESGFETRAKGEDGMNLMAHVNWLAQNMHLLATAPDPEPEAKLDQVEHISNLTLEPTEKRAHSPHEGDERSHIKVIPRPPEWSTAHNDGEDSSDAYDSDEESSDEDDDEEHGVALPPAPESTSTTNPERGVSLNLPNLELYGIELLELTSLSITIKCERCKETMDISNLRTSAPSNAPPAKPRNESCKKCASPLTITYRHELMHPNSFRAGYLDLEGCTVLDMLPSTFLPTCSVCSTTFTLPGITSVRGATSPPSTCRDCHRKMSFRLPEIKFLLISSAARSHHGPPLPRKRHKENLGITAGSELPRRGRCPHYSKSYRWFRFSCCAKVYPCDRCHDAAEAHPNEHANRMICGWCSREQNYRPEDCGVCHASVVKKAGSGFWEGGKGTRDKGRMSRKGEFFIGEGGASNMCFRGIGGVDFWLRLRADLCVL